MSDSSCGLKAMSFTTISPSADSNGLAENVRLHGTVENMRKHGKYRPHEVDQHVSESDGCEAVVPKLVQVSRELHREPVQLKRVEQGRNGDLLDAQQRVHIAGGSNPRMLDGRNAADDRVANTLGVERRDQGLRALPSV